MNVEKNKDDKKIYKKSDCDYKNIHDDDKLAEIGYRDDLLRYTMRLNMIIIIIIIILNDNLLFNAINCNAIIVIAVRK